MVCRIFYIHQYYDLGYHPGTSILTHNYMNLHGISAATTASLQKGLPSPRWFPLPAASAGLAAWPEKAGFPKSIYCGDWGSNGDLTTENQQTCEYLQSSKCLSVNFLLCHKFFLGDIFTGSLEDSTDRFWPGIGRARWYLLLDTWGCWYIYPLVV